MTAVREFSIGSVTCACREWETYQMKERFKPPLVVVVVGRPNSTDWCFTAQSGKVEHFFDDLFRCLSYEIGSRHAADPAIPVYFSIGHFGPDATSPPPLINIPLAQRTVVIVLLDSGFKRATSRWVEFFEEMRKRAQNSENDLLFIPMARTDDGQLRRDVQRLGLGTVAPVYARAGDDQYRQANDIRRHFRICAMISAIQAIRQNRERQQPIDVFISYAKRDGEDVPDRLRQAFAKYPGISAVVDSMAFSPGVSVDGNLLEQKLAACTCVVVCYAASYANRLWCQREALLANRSDVAMIVVDMHDGLERRGCASLANCPHMRISGGIDGHLEEIVELAVSEILRIAHHRSRSAAMLARAGIDPQRVEILVRKPELIRLIDLAAKNAEAISQDRRPRDLILHPDPPLDEHELNVLTMVDQSFQFLTPSTVLIDTVVTEET
jgi:TIR domain